MIKAVKRLRVYADTSVFGGCFDKEFEGESRFVVVISDITAIELEGAPPEVQALLTSLPGEQVEIVASSNESRALRDAYIEAAWLGALP